MVVTNDEQLGNAVKICLTSVTADRSAPLVHNLLHNFLNGERAFIDCQSEEMIVGKI